MLKRNEIDFSKLIPPKLEMPRPTAPADEACKKDHSLNKDKRVKQSHVDIVNVLLDIPSYEYGEWRDVCFALKNEGYDYELFRAWSASSPMKYDAKACK